MEFSSSEPRLRSSIAALLIAAVTWNSSGQESEDLPSPEDAYLPIAALAKSDPVGAVKKLRDAPDLDPEFFFVIFDDLGFAAHLGFLNEIARDEDLANRFAFDFIFPTLESPESIWEEDRIGEKKAFEIYAAESIQVRNDRILRVLNSAPEDTPPVLLVAALWGEIFPSAWLYEIFLKLGHENPDIEPEILASVSDPNRLPHEQIPPHFREVVDLTFNLAFSIAGDEERTTAQAAVSRLFEILDESELPLSMRLGFASFENLLFGGPSLRRHLPDSIRLQIASWLAEAWENRTPTGFRDSSDTLQDFLEAENHPDWNPAAKRLIEAWPGGSDSGNHSFSWLVGIAAELGPRDTVVDLISRFPEKHPSLAQDPMLALLVRAGFHGIAAQQVADRKNELLRGELFVHSRRYDERLESQLPEFLKLIPDNEVRIVAELHLKILKDDSKAPPKIDRETRLTELAHRIGAFPFKISKAKFTALRLVAEVPSASAEIADVYVEFAQFDRVDQHLTNFLQSENWAELAGDTFNATLLAERYDDAQMIVEKIATSTNRLQGNFHRRNHEEAWQIMARTLSEHLSPPEKGSPGLLPVTRLMAGLPRDFFFDGNNTIPASLIRKNIAIHAETEERTAAWWAWYQSLSKPRRREHDTTLVHYLHDDRYGSGRNSQESDRTPPAVLPYLALTGVFSAMPPSDRTATERLDAVLPKLGPAVPAAIRVLHGFRYLSAEEILNHADRLAAALPDGKKARKWRDLIFIAEIAERSALAAEFRRSRDSQE